MNATASPRANRPAAAPHPGGGNRRLLCAEDDPGIRMLLDHFLREAGYEVEMAEDGERAWEMLHAAGRPAPDALLTDFRMPRLTGLGLAARLRAAGWEIPILLVSGSIGDCDPALLERIGFAGCVPKPFSPDTLLKTLSRTLDGRGCGRGLPAWA